MEFIILIILAITFYKISQDFLEAERVIFEKDPKEINILYRTGQWFTLIFSHSMTFIFSLIGVFIWCSIYDRLKLKVDGPINDAVEGGAIRVQSSDD